MKVKKRNRKFSKGGDWQIQADYCSYYAVSC